MKYRTLGFTDPDQSKMIETVTTWLWAGDAANDDAEMLHPEFVMRQTDKWPGWNEFNKVKKNTHLWKQHLERDQLEHAAWEVWKIFLSWFTDGDKWREEASGSWTPEDLKNPELIYCRGRWDSAHPEFIHRMTEAWEGWNTQCETQPDSAEWHRNIERDRLENVAWHIYVEQTNYHLAEKANDDSKPMPNDIVTKCGCGALPGEVHFDGCDIERCTVCGGQYLGECCEGHDKAFARWTGIWPGKAEADYMGIDLNMFEAEKWPLVFFVKPEDIDP